jgi:hypothetical protein
MGSLAWLGLGACVYDLRCVDSRAMYCSVWLNWLLMTRGKYGVGVTRDYCTKVVFRKHSSAKLADI